LTLVTIAKFGGSALGVDGTLIPKVINRIRHIIDQNTKVVAVFSAPITDYEKKVSSMTDVAIRIGKNYASSNPVEIEILREVYEQVAEKHITNKEYYNEFIQNLEKFNRHVIVSLKQAAENRRFVDVIRSRTLAYSGEITMSYLMDYAMRSYGVKSDHVDIQRWPIITDDNFEAANFMLGESMHNSSHLIDLVEHNEVVAIGGFIGKTVDGLETTYERGGSDRTAADVAILLHDHYKIKIDFEKDNAVLSADPRIVKNNLQNVKYLSYNEARLAGMFGMKILDPVAIREIDNSNLDIPIVITDMTDPRNFTIIQQDITTIAAAMDDKQEENGNNLVKIVTGRRNCAIVRIESIAASYIIASLEKDKQYHEFVKLSPYKIDRGEITRLLFLDADYVRRHVRHFRAYDPKVEIVYERGVVTLIGDLMWRMPKIASEASSMVGEHDINILNLDAQEETSRILIIVEDKGTNVGDAVKAIHAMRTKVSSSNSNIT
jgi:aspartate kinase